MSYHIITVLQPGSRLSVDRGFLVCHYPDKTEKRLALADVRSIIIGVPSVSFSNEALARLMAQDSLVLHCDSHYKPIGWTSSFDRVVRREVFANQIAQDAPFHHSLWKAVVGQKMRNQAAVLDSLGIDHGLTRLIKRPLPNEANVSRQYWGDYFEALGQKQKRERKDAETFENKALNYGYAVISTLVHRAVLIHGLLPSLGIHHEFRFRSQPLVYDLMEPFRPFVDLFLADWFSKQQEGQKDGAFADEESRFKSWIAHLMGSLRLCRIKIPEDKHSHKLMDAMDQHVRSVATCFEDKYFMQKDLNPLWLPKLEYHYWQHPSATEAEDDPDEERVAV